MDCFCVVWLIVSAVVICSCSVFVWIVCVWLCDAVSLKCCFVIWWVFVCCVNALVCLVVFVVFPRVCCV